MEHLNVNMCIIGICMVTSYVIIKHKCADFVIFDVFGGATMIRPTTG